MDFINKMFVKLSVLTEQLTPGMKILPVLDTYSLDKLTQIANFFQIEPTELLDDYHLFLYHGQGAQIKRLRKSLNLTQSQFANYIDVPLGTLKKWEQDRVNIQRTTYEKLSQLSSPSPHV